ncbi:MAG TPA: DNA-3-methyladenine glycosylase [Terriglobales bacterium]|nr:DNA-3-methyladenine glycosylase [Terriglobales bacterium]
MPVAALTETKRSERFSLGKRQPLAPEFFNRDPREVARELLGKVLVRREGRKLMAGRVVETEAYLGANDAAAHAASGRTARNQVLFGPPGHAYVYFIYGNHYCLNVSCMPKEEAGCVLFRALEPLAGFDEMARRRGIPAESVRRSETSLRMLTSGPGRLCEALGITRSLDNGVSMTSRGSRLWIGDDGYRPKEIATTTRTGITKDAHHPLRYLIAGNPFVSGARIENCRSLATLGVSGSH